MTSAPGFFRSFTASLLLGTGWRSSDCCYSRRHASSTSSKIWQTRQTNDTFAKQAKLFGLKSRAAFKLLELNKCYKIFSPGQTVVDLGCAPGSWSQVAIDRTSPGGRVVGVDIIPAMPPKGVSTIQGNFLAPSVRAMLRDFLSDPDRGRPRVPDADKAYIDMERQESELEGHADGGRHVDVVLSDLMMNTSGIAYRDHAGSMDLCNAALMFALENLKSGGSFVCKFYAGSEDKDLEKRIKAAFRMVVRAKPESSRKESRENYFVALGLDIGAAKELPVNMPHTPRYKI